MTTPSKYFPLLKAKLRVRTLTIEAEGPDAVAQLRAGLQRAGIVSTDPNAKRAKPAGSSPALRIACPVCGAAAGAYCTKTGGGHRGFVERQTIAHKKRREEEERTR